MATTFASTPQGVTKAPRNLFSHSLISRMFTQLNVALAAYIEFERDLEHADCFDPAFLSFTTDAEGARAEVLSLSARIASLPLERREDLPLKRSAMLTRALIESDSEATFTSLHRLLGTHAELFACFEHNVGAARVRQMLETCHGQIAALSDLGEFSDPAVAWDDDAPHRESDTVTLAPAL
ncbi:MAG: hypothetical protein KKD08_03535 [Alphaproteobacteria bacterium]|nr:hypothetical protein [Alphaproteobacteria bacterium]